MKCWWGWELHPVNLYIYAGLKLLEIIGGAHPKFADKEDFPQGLSLTHCELALSFW